MVYNFCLCSGRHVIPVVTNAIFNFGISPEILTDPVKLERIAGKRLDRLIPNPKYPVKINLYVTGLTVALIAALNAAKQRNYSVVLYHYNRDTDDYYKQEVL